MNSLNVGRKNKKCNNGSALITVVVSMLFVMALGAALLYAAYTTYTIRIMERGDSQNFYSASSAMDDIRAGIQTKVTTSISTAYTAVLTDYTDPSHGANYNPQNDFNARFITALSLSDYNADGLRALIDSKYQGKCVVSTGTVVQSSSGGVLTSVTLKAVSIKYVDRGYESNVVSDITIKMPDFFAGSSITSSINNSAIIANNSLTASANAVAVSGTVFVGSGGISVSPNGSTLAINKGDVICKGPLSVGASTAFTYDETKNEMWAKEINVGASANVHLNGKIFISDDLAYNGGGATVRLENSYFGFGNDSVDSSKSSSILINARNSTLDISNLDKFSLAGVSFIDAKPDENTTVPIMMGESLSMKSDQLVYLVPEKCITYRNNGSSNPCVFAQSASSADCTPTINRNIDLWGTGKTLSFYLDGKGEIKTVIRNLDSNLKIVYVFLVFNNKTNANEYFKAYFSANPTQIAQYLNIYANLSDKKDGTIIDTAGNSFYMDDNGTPLITADDKLTLVSANDSVYAEGYQRRFNTILLQSPYSAYVNANKLSTIGKATLEFVKDGNTVAIVSTDDSYEYKTGSQDTVRLIISSTNVKVSKPFHGVIIAGGSINLTQSVTSEPLDSAILEATCPDNGYTLSDFLGNGAQFDNTASTNTDAWDLDSLVVYNNWEKS